MRSNFEQTFDELAVLLTDDRKNDYETDKCVGKYGGN